MTKKEAMGEFDRLSLLEVSLRLALTAEEAIEMQLGPLRDEFVRSMKRDVAKRPKPTLLRLTQREQRLKNKLMKQFKGAS
jgi:hypothetical protein